MHKKAFSYRFFGLLVAISLLTSLLLSACNSTKVAKTSLNLPPVDVENGVVITPTPTQRVNAPANNGTTNQEAATATVVPTVTPTAAPTSTPLPPTATAVPTSTPRPTATPSGPLEKIDKEAELKKIKAAYDAINAHFYKDPDNTTLLTDTLNELSSITGVPTPGKFFGGSPDEQWSTFAEAYNQMLDVADSKGFKFAKGDLSTRLVLTMSDAVNDLHTYYQDKTAYQSNQRLLRGENTTVGFGISVVNQNNKAYVIKVVAGSGAEEAGLKVGDEIVAYDDKPINGQNWTIVRAANENETHKFTLNRKGEAAPLILNITKRVYNVPTVEYRLINGHIGYIAITQFFANVANEMDKAMRDLYSKGATAWIIDVRNNPGGVWVEQALGRFVDGGEVMGYNTDRKGQREQKVSNQGVRSSNNGKPFKPLLPLVVLINGESGSASEMLALGVRDFQLGTLIGEKTAGALGHTQSFPLGDGTAIAVTIDEYTSRNGEKANNLGVKPDIEVGRTIQDYIEGRDLQLQAGIEQLDKILANKKP